ncbi:hypothetical protein [Tsukamurella tyrosinosolvens]|uniref:hypothetical protein n=1 Tax=Tsukamurella tyrosinosolvens TaxID=57704 RepID=UPI00125FC6F4|nr:hypothetical protein [Tsukamurella tyrosinosolvens]
MVDPFCGTGTVLLESINRRIPSIGIEQNPLGALASRVKTTPLDGNSIIETADLVLATAKRTRRFAQPNQYVQRWYSNEAYSALRRLSACVASTESNDLSDAMALILALTAKHVANTDRRIHVPVSPKFPVFYSTADVWHVWTRESRKLARRISRLSQDAPPTLVSLGDSRDARAWASVPNDSRSLIFTSPPYGAAQKYIRSSSLELGWLQHASDRGTIALEHNSVGREHLAVSEPGIDALAHHPRIAKTLRSISSDSPNRAAIYATYFSDMERVVAKFDDRASRIVIISGTNNVAGKEIATYALLRDLIQTFDFRLKVSFRDEIRGRTLLTKRNSGGAPARAEYIEVFERIPR